MKELRSYGSDFEAHYAAGLLKERGIPCEVRSAAFSEEPPFHAVWLLRDTDVRAALEALGEGRDLHARAWACPNCRSENEAHFDACWSCGTARS